MLRESQHERKIINNSSSLCSFLRLHEPVSISFATIIISAVPAFSPRSLLDLVLHLSADIFGSGNDFRPIEFPFLQQRESYRRFLLIPNQGAREMPICYDRLFSAVKVGRMMKDVIEWIQTAAAACAPPVKRHNWASL